MSWPLGQPTSSECRPSAVTRALEAPAWRNSLRPWLKVCLGGKKTPRKRVSSEMFRNGRFEWQLRPFCFAERSQNNIAVILGAAVGGAAMLLIVVVVLFLRRRSVIMFPYPLLHLSVCLFLYLSVPFISLTAPPSSASSLINLLFLCGAPEWPLHSLFPHLSLSVFLQQTCSFSLSGSVSRHSLGKNLHWMRLVISQWLYSSKCWILWKEIGQGWYIVGDKRHLVPSAPGHRHIVKVTQGWTTADSSLSLSWLPVRHSVFTSEQQTVSL